MQDCKIQIKRVGNGWLVSRNFNEEVKMIEDGKGHAYLLQTVANMTSASTGYVRTVADAQPDVCVVDPIENPEGLPINRVVLYHGNDDDDLNTNQAYIIPSQLIFKARNGEIVGPHGAEVALWLRDLAHDLGWPDAVVEIDGFRIACVPDEEQRSAPLKVCGHYLYQCANKKCLQGEFNVPVDGEDSDELCPNCGKKGFPVDRDGV